MTIRALLLTLALAATADLRDAQNDARKAAHVERAESAMQREERTRTATMGVRA